MSLNEFAIIAEYFSAKTKQSSSTVLGIGDDAALLQPDSGQQLVTSVDTLNEGIHFPKGVSAFDLGHKSLAVSLSDMAAMGAQPFAVLMAISLPEARSAWIKEFAAGFFQLASKFQVDLIGGDTTRGPLSISITVLGYVPKGQAFLRSQAQPGDLLYVTGSLGDAGLALELLLNNELSIDQNLLARLHRPEPRISEALSLRGMIKCAMDVSDGLIADCEKLCHASQVGATIYADQLPLSAHLRAHCSLQAARRYALISGDDYELIFTAPRCLQAKLSALPVTQIGEMTDGLGVCVLDENRQVLNFTKTGYDHFNEGST